MNVSVDSHKRNNSISYIKGMAILGVILIHLFDWCEVNWSLEVKNIKEGLFPFVMLFIATAGSLMVIATKKYSLAIGSKRLIKRSLEIFAVYFGYNILKVLIFDFHKQPFYLWQIEAGTLNWLTILKLKAFSVPITILLTIATFVMLSPLVIILLRKLPFPKTCLVILTSLIFILNYFVTPQSHFITDFLYSKNYVLFPIALWSVPFLIGMYLALLDLEKYKYQQIIFWGLTTGVTYFWWRASGHTTWQPSTAMYPLHPYYISFSFFFMFVLVTLFAKLETLQSLFIKRVLATIQMYGDNTLELYILHWIIIDLASWVLYPHLAWLWLIMPIFFIFYTYVNRTKVARYLKN